jgi:hypothetical protein
MASGIIYGVTGNQYIDSKIEWSDSVYDLNLAMSKVTASLYYKRNNTGYATSGTGSFKIYINGASHPTTSKINIGSSWVLAATATQLVTHNDDGTKKITISADGSIPNTTLTSTTCSEYVTLRTIERASEIDWTPTGNTYVRLGDNCNVKWYPRSKSFRYTLKFSLGDWSYTTGLIHPNTTAQYTYRGYALPYAVARQVTDSDRGKLTVTLYTYASQAATTPFGASQPKEHNFLIPDNETFKPEVSMQLTPVSTLKEPFSSLYIQGRSGVKATITTSEPSEKYGATIVSKTMTLLGKSYAESFETGYLYKTGNVDVVATAIDSRGFVGSVSKSITVIPYSEPKLLPASDEGNIICARCDAKGILSDSGTSLKIKARRGYSKVEADDGQKNFCAIRYRYVQEGSEFTGDAGWETLLDSASIATDTVDSILLEGKLSAETSYIVQVGVIDEFGESEVVQYIIPTDFITIDIPKEHKGKRIGLLRYAQDTDEEGIDVGAPIYGGSIDSLKVGTRLTATAESNLNLGEVRTPGCYYSPDKDTTQYIIGAPANVDFGFGLEVREMQSAENIRQTLYYGITTWYRHWNGTEWSAWVSSLTGVSSEVTAQDFVVDRGKASVWNYRLWQSGDAELWGLITLSEYGDTRHIYTEVGLPFVFPEYPTVSMTLSQAEAYAYMQKQHVLSEVYGYDDADRLPKIRLVMIRDEGGFVVGNTARVSVVIRGKWK